MTKLAGSKPLVLVLEDEALIALNLQDELQDAGYAVAGPFTTCCCRAGVASDGHASTWPFWMRP